MRTLFVLLLVPLFVAGCETVGGFGQDVEAGGEAITDLSNEVENDL